MKCMAVSKENINFNQALLTSYLVPRVFRLKRLAPSWIWNAREDAGNEDVFPAARYHFLLSVKFHWHVSMQILPQKHCCTSTSWKYVANAPCMREVLWIIKYDWKAMNAPTVSNCRNNMVAISAPEILAIMKLCRLKTWGKYYYVTF